MNTVGKRIKQIRDNFNLTQKQLADKLNISIASLNKTELHGNNLKSIHANTLHKEYKIDLNWLFTGEGTMFGNHDIIPIKKSMIKYCLKDEKSLISFAILQELINTLNKDIGLNNFHTKLTDEKMEEIKKSLIEIDPECKSILELNGITKDFLNRVIERHEIESK